MSDNGLSICMPDFSGFANQAYRTGMLEAQDILCEVANVDRVVLRARPELRSREGWLGRMAYHDFTRRLALVNPGLERVRLDRQYDVFLVVCPWWRDLWYCNAIENWQECAKLRICWIDELWLSDIDQLRRWLPSLRRFDYVFVSIDGSGPVLADRIERPCFDLPGGCDTLRFSPVSRPVDRSIDIFSIGRRSPDIHRELATLADRQNLFYLFDTLQSGDSRAADHAEHRTMYANTAKRSRIFMVAPGKWDTEAQAAGQAATGFRYFEGAAAGAALLGQVPHSQSFRDGFDWTDSVVALKPDGSDAARVAAELLADRDRLERIHRRNAAQSLLRHDWIYRWRLLFERCGLEPTPGMLERIATLRSLSEQSLPRSDTGMT